MRAEFDGNITFDAPGGQRQTIPIGKNITFTDGGAAILTIPAGTCSGTSYQISSDTFSLIRGYWIKNRLGREVYFAVNDGDQISLGDQGETSYLTPDASCLGTPVTYFMIYLAHHQTTAGTIEFGFFGDP